MYRLGIVIASAVTVLTVAGAEAAVTPAIRTSADNQVPACVTPDRLMEFIKGRNKGLDERFGDTARYYKEHGEALGVRWDYAFFQMIVETNALKFKTGSGRWGDVKPKQNNFAGLGATGRGAPGESFPDVSTGVLAHLGHIRLYSGYPLESPAAKRTKLVEDLILPWAQGFDRPVTFTDLTTKWSPGDKGYSDDIESVARSYRSLYCTRDEDTVQPTAEVTASADAPVTENTSEAGTATETATADLSAGAGQTAETAAADTLDPAATATKVALNTPKAKPAGGCKVFTASYGGAKSLLIQSVDGAVIRYTALAVHDGKETAQAEAFINAYAQGGHTIGTYGSQDEALSKAFQLCPDS